MEALRKAIELHEDAGKILHLSEKVLTQTPKSPFALHCKAIALLQSNGSNAHKVSSALVCFEVLKTLVESGSLGNKNITETLGLPDVATLVFQHAYGLYRLKDYTAVVALLKTSDGTYAADATAFASANLLGQSYYNLELFAKSAAVYEQLLEEADDDDYDNVVTNLSACYAAMGETKKCELAVRKADQKLFEHLLNCATAAVESGDSEAAKGLLEKAEQLLRREGEANGATVTTVDALEKLTAETLALSPEDKEFADDYALILIQRAFIAHRYDDDPALADHLLKLIINLRIGTQTTLAIASVNLATISNTNFYDTYRTLKQVQAPAVFGRLNERQRRVVQFNTALLLLNTGKVGESKRIADRLAAEHANWGAVPLLLAAILMHNKRISGASAEAELEKAVSDDNAASRRFKQLAIAQVRLRTNDISGAVAALEADADLLAHPSIVATLCDLQAASGQLSKAAALLSKQAPKTPKLQTKVVGLAETLIRNGLGSDALSLLDATTNASSRSNEVSALRVMAIAASDVRKAEALATSLDIASASVTASAEVSNDEVDTIVSRAPTRADTEAAGFVASSSVKEDTRKSGNRRRPMRHPCKGLKPDAKVDYERWLPLSIRTYYKDLPERRKNDMRRLRREEQAVKRKQVEKRKAEAVAAAAAQLK